ncbi:TPA: conjugal transfer protein TraN [Vibrio cholerae]
MWKNTDQVLDNLTDITKDFANCTLTTELISSGKDYHVPKYETCEKLPVVEETFTISHEYKVGILRHKSGPVNLVSCGNGCTQVWIGTVGNNYWPGWCTIYEESMSVEVLKPDKITYAVLDRSKFDDYHQVYLNGVKIYNGPNGEFPPEVGTKCELSTSWDTRPNINVTSSFTSVPEYGEITFKTRTSVAGEGEGYSSLLVYYNMNDLVYGDNWTTQENIDKAFQVKKQIDDGYCTGSFQCTDMPSLDAAGCTVMNGVKVCESNFKSNPFASLGISPFCRKVEVTSNCGFNEGQFCSKDLNGVERCFDNDTVDRNQCKKYEENPTCSYIKSECVEGAEGSSGHCYVQEDTYDCGFTASTGQPKEEQVLRCNGKLQCVGENCYSPARDGANEDFGKVNAYLEMLKYAKADMTCQGIPESPYDADAPPDQYIPVPSCADGFVYNKQTNQCLKPTGCTYSDNDFYAASSRNGIQVLVGNQVVVDDASVPTCIPVKKNGVTYTCGEAKKKLATDTFYEVCTNAESPVIPSGCPSPDHTLNPKTGYCEIPPTPTCPEGVPLIEGGDPWSVLDDKCLLDIPAVPKCNNANETYDATTGRCIREEPASISCPTSYPIWNAEENRCESSSISPLANVRSQFELNNEPLNPTQTQEVIAMVLSPFEHMLDTLIPKANASSELQGSEEAKLTQETMQQYVAEQFLSMAEEQQNNIALTTVGRQQLMGLASASSTAQPMSMSTMSTSSVTTSSGGDTNVTCELFKGTASECKIAVGGMQNCCESPVAVTLADYISLTTKMMQMDALTGQVMGLENYPGVWETASTWGSATAQSAWSAVQGEFISPADIVKAVAEEGAENTIMSEVSKKMMQYTYDFLYDSFGHELASMFFANTGSSAAAGTVTGASAQMAAAGQALMYVYYAYMAYVVFNLLVNVIYECEEEELDLAMKRELLSTHKIGSYCKTEVLGACIEKRQSYCVFDSPLSRIMMEQIYAQSQMNLNWGTAKKPNCTGVGIQDLDKVDWDKVNLDEWIGILISTGNYTDMVNVNIDSLTGKGSNLNTQQGGTDRNNVLEANRERMENIDADEVRRDAYEDAWSRSQ